MKKRHVLVLSDMWSGPYRSDMWFMTVGSFFVMVGSGFLTGLGVGLISFVLYERLINLGDTDED